LGAGIYLEHERLAAVMILSENALLSLRRLLDVCETDRA